MTIFWNIFLLKPKKLPLQLHIRGQNAFNHKAASRATEIMKKAKVPDSHPVYCHAFHGGLTECEGWLRLFPNTYFGLSPGVLRQSCPKQNAERPKKNECKHLHEECKLVFNNLPKSRVLLETDGPVLEILPWDVCECPGVLLARIRGHPVFYLPHGQILRCPRFCYSN